MNKFDRRLFKTLNIPFIKKKFDTCFMNLMRTFIMKKNDKVKKYKTIAGLKRALKRKYNEGTSFYSDNKKVQKLLEDIGIVAICGATGVGIGFAVAGPTGALVGGIVGVFTGLVITERIKIKEIRFDPFDGGYSVTFV